MVDGRGVELCWNGRAARSCGGLARAGRRGLDGHCRGTDNADDHVRVREQKTMRGLGARVGVMGWFLRGMGLDW
jgi:hypothetical protein